MEIEKEVFKRASIDFKKLILYGFIKNKENYTYNKTFMDGEFKAEISIDKNKNIKGNVIDLNTNETYLPLRAKYNKSAYRGLVLKGYSDILEDIKEKCTTKKEFIFSQSNRIANSIYEKYSIMPDFPWEKYEGAGVFRNKNNKKWFALIMNIDKSKLDKKLKGEVEIINLKAPNFEIEELIKKKGYYSAYHMNKKNWFTIILDETLDDEIILSHIQKSRDLTK